MTWSSWKTQEDRTGNSSLLKATNLVLNNRIAVTYSSEKDTNRVPDRIQEANHDTNLLRSDGSRRRRIAYAVTITKDGNVQDGAAVLAYSIYESSMKGDDLISFVAFVHPSVTTSRPTLKKLGYHVIEGNDVMTEPTITLHCFASQSFSSYVLASGSLWKLFSTAIARSIYCAIPTFLFYPILPYLITSYLILCIVWQPLTFALWPFISYLSQYLLRSIHPLSNLISSGRR